MWKSALLCAGLAWGGKSRAAIFAVPAPTFAAPVVDGWSPAPTEAPLGIVELLRRDDENPFISKGTCGFLDGSSASPVTCRQSGYVCATNTYWGNHGCCDPYEAPGSCTLQTTCFPRSLMSQSCTDRSCLSNNFVAKCTLTAQPECYELGFVYTIGARTTTMKEYGCTDTALTTTVPLVYKGYSAPGSGDSSTSSSQLSSTSPSPSQNPQSSSHANNTPAIIGGVIGGLVIVGALVFAIVYLLLRDRRRKRELAQSQARQHQDWPSPNPSTGMVEVQYHPEGFVGCNVYGEEPRSGGTDDTSKSWLGWGSPREKKGAKDRVTSCGEGMYGVGVVETEGRMVCEAPA